MADNSGGVGVLGVFVGVLVVLMIGFFLLFGPGKMSGGGGGGNSIKVELPKPK